MNQLHFIVPHLFNASRLQNGIKKALQKFGCLSASDSAILSFIGMCKFNCITKEKYDEMYKTNKEYDERINLTAGEDLETFIAKIKFGEINKNTIPYDGDFQQTFLLCLLNEEETTKLEQKDEAFLETFRKGVVDIPAAEWKESGSSLKFARSRCTRDTYFIDT